MKNFILAGAAAVALAIPAASPAQTGNMNNQRMEMSAAQKSAYDSWPAERRTMYDAWPNTYKVYFWELTPQQQTGWWALTDDQRTRVYAMTPDQRTAAWTAIQQQLAGANANSSMNGMATSSSASSNMSMSGNMRFVSNAVVQATPNDAGPPTGDVPICGPNMYDNCINAWEAGRRGPNVTRPLSYWPGSNNDPRSGE